ncbi:MAG: acetylglutamate kinase [Patescibacteria group bacterium]
MDSCPCRTGFLFLNNLMRMLWEQHAAWTRMTTISIAEGLADEELVTRRLLRNPADIAAVFRPLYGNEIAQKLNDLITTHLVLAAQLVKESKAGDTAAAAETERRWYANGEEIAAFLSSINPYWSREEMTRMWREHLDLVKAQAVARLNKDYAADIAFYDEGEQLLLRMADEFTAGLIRQFPCFYAAG